MTFEKLKFQLRAKGRHGTHSPFVYAFVERVLRSKAVFKNRPEGFPGKAWQRLNATLEYLKADDVFFSENFSDEIKKALSDNWPKIRMKDYDIDVPVTTANAVLLLSSDEDMALTQLPDNCPAALTGRLSIYVMKPYDASWTSSNIAALKNNSVFKMVLDFWDGLLLVRSSDFKEKQFFELR